MALALCLTLLPATAQAVEDGHAHCVCGLTHKEIGDHTADTKTAFEKRLTSDAYDNLCIVVGESTDENSAPTDNDTGFWRLPAGNYYLQSGVTIDKPIVIRENVTICLNGKTLQSTADNQPVFWIMGGELTLTNCNGTGKVIHNSGRNGKGTGVKVELSGKFNLYDGTITENTAEYGGGVLV